MTTRARMRENEQEKAPDEKCSLQIVCFRFSWMQINLEKRADRKRDNSSR